MDEGAYRAGVFYTRMLERQRVDLLCYINEVLSRPSTSTSPWVECTCTDPTHARKHRHCASPTLHTRGIPSWMHNELTHFERYKQFLVEPKYLLGPKSRNWAMATIEIIVELSQLVAEAPTVNKGVFRGVAVHLYLMGKTTKFFLSVVDSTFHDHTIPVKVKGF